ncbi:MAG: hypothetical protein RLZZ519_1285 [Bacteroidota bacterium]|jgi:thymidine phosphorylase
MNHPNSHRLTVKDIGIDTFHENIAFMSADSYVCKSEGFTALARILIKANGNSIIATLNVVKSDLVADGEVGLSLSSLRNLHVQEKDTVTILHPQPVQSFARVRAKMYGAELTETDFDQILIDIIAERYANIEVAAFVTACAGTNMTLPEIVALSKSMIHSGSRIEWGKQIVADKHCVGGLPGNRTTPIVVSIVAAAGLMIPKTSSKAITSPAGTADTMETMTKVDLTVEQIRAVVEQEGGCMVWGGAVRLSPADDILIRIEKALDIDSEGQMIASVLSKKAAAGSTHVILDIPVGPTAKVRSQEEAVKLETYFKAVAATIGLQVEVVITDGSQPVGRGIGPALEAVDVLKVLRNEQDAPRDLRDRAVMLAARLLKLSRQFPDQDVEALANQILNDGRAFAKFQSICIAQGGFREPGKAEFKYEFLAAKEGIVRAVDNRNLSRLAKLAGAPKSPTAGIYYEAPIGRRVVQGDLLFSIHAASVGELSYAVDFLNRIQEIITIEP